MSLSPSPRVTVAVPLYRSAPFLDILRANLRRLTLPDLEILVSDRHLLDDAIDRLEREFGADPRIRFLRHRDAIGWVDHFNALLGEARGRFFMWMPHDDDFPEDYLPRLVAALEASPDAILAFGRLNVSGDHHERIWRRRFRAPDELAAEPWSLRLHLRLATHWNPGVAFRGLFRRAPLTTRDLLIRHTRKDILADFHWVFATGFLGPWIYVPECCCEKRLHPGSAHARWKFSPGQWLDALCVLSGYVGDFAPRRRDALYARATLSVWVASNLMFHLVRRSSALSRPAKPLHAALRSLLARMVGLRNPTATDSPATQA